MGGRDHSIRCLDCGESYGGFNGPDEHDCPGLVRHDECPHCSASLIGSPIPASHQEAYGGKTHFRRDILIEVQGVYDGGLLLQCPDCRGYWHRWPKGTPQRAQAEGCLERWSAE